MGYLSKDEIKQRLFDFHETTVASVWLGGAVLLRELTAGQRLMVNDAAQNEDGAAPNNAFYRAALLQLMLVDPTSGQPYTDGRVHPETGQPLIDPRTRTPYFTSDELAELMDGREGAIDELLSHGLRLSRLLPTDFRNGTASADAAQHDQGSGAETGATEHREDGAGEDRAADLGAPHDPEAIGDDGDTDRAPAVGVME